MDGLTNAELRERLLSLGANVGPIMDSTRSVWLKKLTALEKEQKKKPAEKQTKISSQESEEANVKPVKKGRGRPPKKTLEASDTEEEAEKTPPRSPRKRTPKKVPETKVIPGLANFPNASPKKAANKNASVLSSSGLNSSSRVRRTAGNLSLGYSEGETEENEEEMEVSMMDRSINTSFKRPSIGSLTRSPLFHSSPRDSYSSSFDYRRTEPGSAIPPAVDLKFRRPSPLKAAMNRLSNFRTSAARKISDAYGRPTHDGDRKVNWRPTLSEHTSKVLVVALGAFLLLIALVYVGSVNRSKLTTSSRIVGKAVVDTGVFIYHNLIFPLICIAIALGLGVGIYYYREWRRSAVAEEKRQIFVLVNQIINILQKTAEQYEMGEKNEPCLPIPHIRDLLIRPEERKEMKYLWDKAEEYINENESRVRTETQFVAGMEISVWRWLQPIGSPGAEDKKWQGHAFSEAPHQMALNASAMGEAFSECLKLRGMFGSPDEEEEEDWPDHIQDALLEKLGSERRVVHMAVDRGSKDGCVYMKLATRREAGSAFKLLHGSWFNGRLVSVKYLRRERYDDRFPASKQAVYALEMKKPRQSVLWE